MTSADLWPLIAGGLFAVFAGFVSVSNGSRLKHVWMFPAALSFFFLLFSLYSVANEGLFGFWVEHTRNLWGNQIWLDLLIACGIAWVLIVPHARRQGMHILYWLILIAGTGSIGFLAMMARLLYLQQLNGDAKADPGYS